MKIVTKDPLVGSFIWELPDGYQSLLQEQIKFLKEKNIPSDKIDFFEKAELNELQLQLEVFIKCLIGAFLGGRESVHLREILFNMMKEYGLLFCEMVINQDKIPSDK